MINFCQQIRAPHIMGGRRIYPGALCRGNRQFQALIDLSGVHFDMGNDQDVPKAGLNIQLSDTVAPLRAQGPTGVMQEEGHITADFFGYGFLLPREVDVLDKNGHKIGTRQDMRPAVLTSTGRFFEIFGGEIKGLGIRFEAMPSAMSLRMNLQTISAYALIGGNNSDVAEIHKSIRDQF